METEYMVLVNALARAQIDDDFINTSWISIVFFSRSFQKPT